MTPQGKQDKQKAEAKAQEPQPGKDIPNASAGGDTQTTRDPSQPALQEADQTAPEEASTPQGGEGDTSGEGEQVATEREAIVGEQGVGNVDAMGQTSAIATGFDPNAPVATSAPPANAQSGVPTLPENEGVEPGDQS
jgi:hypothetical protein